MSAPPTAAPEPLGKKMARALSYSALITGTAQLLSLVRSMVLARLLLPDDFGLFGLVMTVVSGLLIFTTMGVEQVVITTPIESEEQRLRWASTAWWVNLAKGVVIFCAVQALASTFAGFFEEPRLVPLLRMAALVPLFQMFSSVGLIYLSKELDLKRVFYWESLKGIFGFVVTLTLCFILKDVRALVIGLILTEGAGAAFSYIIAPMWPRFVLARDLLARVGRFSRSVLPVAIMTFITTQIDDVAIGKLLGTEELGYYTLAYTFALLPIRLIGQVLERMMLPAFARAIEEGGVAQGAALWLAIFEAMAWLLAALLFPIFYFHEEVVVVVYGAQWARAAPLLAVMLWLGLFRSWTHISSRMLFALDKPHINARAKYVETAIFLGLLFWLVPAYGAIGGAIAGLVNYILAFLFRSVYVVWRCEMPWLTLPRAAAKLSIAFAMLAPIWWVARGQGWLSLLAGAAGALLILALAVYTERELVKTIRPLIRGPKTARDDHDT